MGEYTGTSGGNIFDEPTLKLPPAALLSDEIPIDCVLSGERPLQALLSAEIPIEVVWPRPEAPADDEIPIELELDQWAALEDERAEARDPRKGWSWAVPGGEGTPLQPTVLFVEHNPRVLGVGKRMLTHLGWHVITAASGHEALEKYRRNRRHIDCVLLDRWMPGMDGPETMRRIRRVDGRARFVLASDYDDPPPSPTGSEPGWEAYLPKPYLLPELRDALEEALCC